MPPRTVVGQANHLSASELQIFIANNALEGFATRVVYAKELDEFTKQSIWEIFEENMYIFYRDSGTFGWHPEEKKEELFNDLSRFVLVSPASQLEVLAAFSMFRFEYEKPTNIIYCYEIQVRTSYQRKGLGRFITNALETIGRKCRMRMMMLTVLKANSNAVLFYKEIGFTVDDSSPTDSAEDIEQFGHNGVVDYQILSKRIPKTSR